MSLGQWALACLWLVGIMIVVAVILGLVALADPARRGEPRAGDEGPRP
jgi:hypothetical protein